mmetsp:Transcript_131502/g.256181  ORF Transcript_131502/g.256181 Transcript_131502/m.256181 type:complete len:1362 (-) Transcript_131502:149-4234(-)
MKPLTTSPCDDVHACKRACQPLLRTHTVSRQQDRAHSASQSEQLTLAPSRFVAATVAIAALRSHRHVRRFARSGVALGAREGSSSVFAAGEPASAAAAAAAAVSKTHRAWYHGRKSLRSLITFSWVKGLLRAGNSPVPVDISDVLPVPPEMQAGVLATEFATSLAKSRTLSILGGDKLLALLGRLHIRQYVLTGILRLCNSIVQFFPAVCLAALLHAVEQAQFMAGLHAAGTLFALMVIKAFVENQYFYHTTNIALRVQAMLQASIYTKSLRLAESNAATPPVTLMQVDTAKVFELAYAVHTLWNGIFQVLGYSFLLIHYVGGAGLAGLAVLALCLPTNAALQRKLSMLNRESTRASEARVSRTGEILEGIRAIRQMGWEDVFQHSVRKLREAEISAKQRRDGVLAILISCFSALPPFMISVVLLVYAGGPSGFGSVAFRPSIVFAALSVLNQIRFPLLFYPSALEALAEGRAAAGRIATFLQMEEAPAEEGKRCQTWREGASSELTVPAGSFPVGGPGSPCVVLRDSLIIRRGELVAVVGPVGAGKTSLVRLLLGEVLGISTVPPAGRIAYCSQQPWIPSGTLRDVITAGIEFDSNAFQFACTAAMVDFARPQDEITGGTLSGGQQARVAIARVVYHAMAAGDGAIDEVPCIFDDVTAALDPIVSAQITEQCLLGVLRQHTRVVVTGDPGPLLQQCDRVIVMEAEELQLHVRAVGTCDDLVKGGHLDASAVYNQGNTHKSDIKIEESVSAKESSDSTSSPIQVVVAEERAHGAIPGKIYRRYFALAASPILLAVAAGCVFATDLAGVAQQWFIGIWTADLTLSRGLPFYLIGVTALGLAASGLTFCRTLIVAAFARRTSRALHRELCQSVLVRASSRYFDANPFGRILQRFAKDLEEIDGSLPGSLRSALACMCTLVGTMVTILFASPLFIICLGPLAFCYWKSLQYYRPVARQLKRLEPLARSPVYAEQAVAAAGVVTIRQLRISHEMIRRALKAVDGSTAVSFATKAVDRWFSLRMELLGNIIVLIVAMLGLSAGCSVAHRGAWFAARTAIAVTQALSVVGLLSWTVRTVAQTETSFSSFQRVTFTIDATQAEAPRDLPGDVLLPSCWPRQGHVSFQGVSVRYRDDLPLVLDGVNLEVNPGQRVGIVGRTGSGKSTLLRVLLRITEMGNLGGSVFIDGVDIREVGLARLRSAVTVIPQENFVVTATVRDNVDPRHEHSDEEVRVALDAASLEHWQLNQKVASSGGSVSPGERQLLGVARAMLRRSRVVALDEVTSRVDETTDRKVQAALRQLPAGTSLLVVSHRLQTLEDYDCVVVMEAGKVVEVGKPALLKQQPSSHYATMLAAELAELGAAMPALV